MTIPFNPSWLGMEPGQLPTWQIKACLAWLDRAIPSLPPQDKARFLAKRDGLQAEFRRRFAKKAQREAEAAAQAAQPGVSPLVRP